MKSVLRGGAGLEERVLGSLGKPKTTSELASEIGKSRSWISYVLNKLEREGKIEEIGRRGKMILYRRIER